MVTTILFQIVVTLLFYLPFAACLVTLFNIHATDFDPRQRRNLGIINGIYHGALLCGFVLLFYASGDGEGILWMPVAYPIWALPFLALTLLVAYDCSG
jgi:hypothetical protein